MVGHPVTLALQQPVDDEVATACAGAEQPIQPVRWDVGGQREGGGGSQVQTAGGSLAGNDASPMSSTLGCVERRSGTGSPVTTGAAGSRSGVGSRMVPVSRFGPGSHNGAGRPRGDGGTPSGGADQGLRDA